MKEGSSFPCAGANRWRPKCIHAHTRIPVNDDPRARTRQLVRTFAKQLLEEVQGAKTTGYLDSLRQRCRRSELIDAYERMQGEVNRP